MQYECMHCGNADRFVVEDPQFRPAALPDWGGVAGLPIRPLWLASAVSVQCAACGSDDQIVFRSLPLAA